MKILLSVCASLILTIGSQSLCSAKVASIKSSDLAVVGKQGENRVPKGWTLDGSKKQVVVWDLNLGDKLVKTVSLSRGASLKSGVKMAPLSEQEQKVKGEWAGFLMVDAYGTESGGQGKLEVSIFHDGSMLVKKELSFRGKVGVSRSKKDRNSSQRRWIYLEPKIVNSLMSGKTELKVSGLNENGVVLKGVEICRLHTKPTRKLEAKPNGHAGPDKVNVGSLGFNMLVEHQQRVASIYDVRKGTIAEKAGLKDGDVLAGVNGLPLSINSANPGWQWFNEGHAATVGNAILDGLAGENSSGVIKLNLFREGKPVVVDLKLPDVFLEEDFFLKPSGEKMRKDMIGYLLKNQKSDGSFGGPIRTTFGALSLIAEKDQQYAPQIVKAVNWMLNKYPNAENFGNLGYWHGSYAGILYCEYYLATGDKRVLPRIQAIHDWVMTGVHTSKWGMACLGHGPSGLPYGNKALMAPTSHLFVFDGLAQKCGLHTQLWETLLPFMIHCWSDPSKKGGHGSMGYNASYKDKAQFWSRTGQSALACAIRGEREDMQNAMTSFMEGNYPFYRNSHAYGEPGGAWGIISLAYTRPDAYKKVMNALRWEFALSWEPGYGMKFSQPHMGAPYMGTDDLLNSAYPLVFIAHKKSLFITGSKEKNWLDVSRVETPLSEVILRQARNGKVWMETKVPGGTIYFTTDGSEPSASSTRYTESFVLEKGGVIKAVSIVSGKSSKVTERTYQPSSAKVKVIAASGHKDPEEAIRRAEFSIDGARYYAWIADRGQDAKGYPHSVVYDLGAICKVGSIKFIHGNKNSGVGECRVYGSIDEAEITLAENIHAPLLGETAWTTFENIREVKMTNDKEVRYLRVEFTKPLVAEKSDFKIEELQINSTVLKKIVTAPKAPEIEEQPSIATVKPADHDFDDNAGSTLVINQSDDAAVKSENDWWHYAILGGLVLIVGVVYKLK